MPISARKSTVLAILSAAIFASLSFMGAVEARELNLDKPEDVLRVYRKMACGSTADGHVEYGVWKGKVFSRVPWELDRHLFDVVGMNVRQCPLVEDPVRGTGYRMVSREIMVYLKPGTNEILESWHNPFNGRDVKVVHVANDPVNAGARFPYSKDRRPLRFEAEVLGDIFVRRMDLPLYYKNPLGGNYQREIGGASQAIEIYIHFVNRAELLNDSPAPLTSMHLSWQRVSQWFEWMQMGNWPGYMISSVVGWRVQKYEELPQVIKEFLNRKEYALFKAPPPADDKRPSMGTEDRYKLMFPDGDGDDAFGPSMY